MAQTKTLAEGKTATLGVLLIVATALTISVQDVVFKLVSGNLTLWQIFTLRGLMTLPLFAALAAARGQLSEVFMQAGNRWSILRGICLTMTFLAFYAALPFLSLSTVGAANYIAPIFVALLSAFVIGEKVGRLGWIGVCLGFAGVVILLQPGGDAISRFALLPVIGAGFYAAGHVITRTKCRTLPSASLALSLNVTMLLAGVLASLAIKAFTPPPSMTESYPYLFGTWSNVTFNDWLVLALLAVLAVSTGLMLAAAYQMAPPATVATFEYSYLIFVALWDILIFSVAPTVYSASGMIMIALAGVLVVRRQKAS